MSNKTLNKRTPQTVGKSSRRPLETEITTERRVQKLSLPRLQRAGDWHGRLVPETRTGDPHCLSEDYRATRTHAGVIPERGNLLQGALLLKRAEHTHTRELIHSFFKLSKILSKSARAPKSNPVRRGDYIRETKKKNKQTRKQEDHS